MRNQDTQRSRAYSIRKTDSNNPGRASIESERSNLRVSRIFNLRVSRIFISRIFISRYSSGSKPGTLVLEPREQVPEGVREGLDALRLQAVGDLL